jgi:plasmid stabilization system protein ParE
MIVRWTTGALADLTHRSRITNAVIGWNRARRLTAIERRISEFPHSAPEVTQRSGVRVVAFVDLPYRLFYSVDADTITVLAIRHTSRQSLFG